MPTRTIIPAGLKEYEPLVRHLEDATGWHISIRPSALFGVRLEAYEPTENHERWNVDLLQHDKGQVVMLFYRGALSRRMRDAPGEVVAVAQEMERSYLLLAP